MLNDLQFGLRQLMKSPGFTVITVLTLAIGIGANTAIFSLINAYLIKPLPFEKSDRLISIWYDSGEELVWTTHGTLLKDLEDNSSQLDSFIGATESGSQLSLTGIDRPKMLKGVQVTGSLLELLGLRPTQGQDFTPENQSATGDDKVVLLSEKTWHQHFYSDPNIVGKSIVLGQESYSVIGLYDEELLHSWMYWVDFDFMIPAAMSKYPYKERDWAYFTVGRLADRATIASAQQEVDGIKAQFANRYPEIIRESKAGLETIQGGVFGFLESFTAILLAAVGLVLLVACANVANLLLARATARQSELALRTAIGASGWRIVRLLLCESVLLSFAGAAGGLLLCLNALPLLNKLITFSNWPPKEFTIDMRVLAFTLAISALTGILFGVFPALKALREGSAKGLSEMSRAVTAYRGNKLQSALIVSEIALSVVLLAAIGLMLKSSANALNADRGFDESNVFSFMVARNTGAETQDENILKRTRFSSELIAQLKQIPGVENATMISQPPMDPRNGVWRSAFWRDDQPDAPKTYSVGHLQVNGQAFSTLGIPLIRGRVIDENDQRLDAHKIAIIDEMLAREKFPDIDPMGQTIHVKNQAYEVVGIVGSIIPKGLDEGKGPIVYTPQVHFPWNTSYFVKTRIDQGELERKILTAVAAIDPDQPIDNIHSLQQIAKDTVTYRTVLNILFALFGCIAILLASIGIYGLMTYLVEQRNREIGIRLAIGALPQEIVAMILKRGMHLAFVGIAVGVIATLVLGRFLSFMLYQVDAYDPLVLLGVILFVLLVTVIACWIPAKTASKVQPSRALQIA